MAVASDHLVARPILVEVGVRVVLPVDLDPAAHEAGRHRHKYGASVGTSLGQIEGGVAIDRRDGVATAIEVEGLASLRPEAQSSDLAGVQLCAVDRRRPDALAAERRQLVRRWLGL